MNGIYKEIETQVFFLKVRRYRKTKTLVTLIGNISVTTLLQFLVVAIPVKKRPTFPLQITGLYNSSTQELGSHQISDFWKYSYFIFLFQNHIFRNRSEWVRVNNAMIIKWIMQNNIIKVGLHILIGIKRTGLFSIYFPEAHQHSVSCTIN